MESTPHGISCVVIDRKGDILILKRARDKKLFPNKWFVVGAYPLSGKEDMKEVASREILEELGEEGEIIKVGNPYKSKLEKVRVIVHPFLVVIKSKAIRLNYEHTEYAWVKFNDLRSYDLVPGTEKVVLALLTK